MAEGDEVKVSKYNSGINIIMRLDDLWRKVNVYASVGKYTNWNSILDRIWCELARDLEENDYKDKKEEFDKMDKALSEFGTFEDNLSETLNKITSDQIKKRNQIYKKLSEKELFLRRLENKVGKGTAWSDGDEDDFE